MLKTIQITLPQELLERIDVAVTELDTNRSQFARHVFEEALFKLWVEKMEREHEASFREQPEDEEETAPWLSIQDPGEPYEPR